MTKASYQELAEWSLNLKQPSLDAPWPGELDAAKWLWNNSVPEFWRREYPDQVDYTDYVAYPQIAGMTGMSYTSVLPIDPNKPLATPGWTMGVGGQFDILIKNQASFGYRLWEALMQPITTARRLIDKTAARLDPNQCPESELDGLFLWANGDRRIQEQLPTSVLRRYVRLARKIERVRGTKDMLPALGEVLGVHLDMRWDETIPYRIRLFMYGRPDRISRMFIRRHFPPHLEIDLEAVESHTTYTGWAMTAKASYVPETTPDETTSELTSTERVSSFLI